MLARGEARTLKHNSIGYRDEIIRMLSGPGRPHRVTRHCDARCDLSYLIEWKPA